MVVVRWKPELGMQVAAVQDPASLGLEWAFRAVCFSSFLHGEMPKQAVLPGLLLPSCSHA